MILPFTIGIQNCYAAKSNKINVYIFEGDGCPHCAEAIEWFEETLAKDSEYSEYYNLVKYEVWYNEENNELMGEVANELGTQASGVPFIVIGEKYFSGFSSASSPETIKETIKEQYNNNDYQDVVKAVQKGISIDRKVSSGTIIPIVVVSAIAIIAVLALVFFTKEK